MEPELLSRARAARRRMAQRADVSSVAVDVRDHQLADYLAHLIPTGRARWATLTMGGWSPICASVPLLPRMSLEVRLGHDHMCGSPLGASIRPYGWLLRRAPKPPVANRTRAS